MAEHGPRHEMKDAFYIIVLCKKAFYTIKKMKEVFNANSTAGFAGWNPNTELDVNLKTMLRGDRCMQRGKDYQGVMRRDLEDHYMFIETLSQAGGKRSPRVYDGELITVTRWDDGSYHPNFKSLKVGADFSVDSYAIRVCNELRHALKGLIEEG